MTSQFPIYRIEPENRSGANTRNDSEGRFYKYWCHHPQLGRCLFKACSPDEFSSGQLAIAVCGMIKITVSHYMPAF
jgi:hypothetical protein